MKTDNKNVKIRKISTTERTPSSEDTAKTVANLYRTKIITAIEVSKRSGVPMLYMSNPGYGKTTTIESYARIEGYHVESLIGSQYSQDEILGFQVRTDKSYLEILEPEWYHRIVSYSKPHYERKSSGNKFVLVEFDDVEKAKKTLYDTSKKIDELKKEIAENTAKKENNTDPLQGTILDVTITTCSLEVKRLEASIQEAVDLLNDIVLVESRPSILFLDELSTASVSVQGAILNLCFNKEIRGSKKLPKGCILLAAANYKQNLPGHVDITSPALNRFCIFNLLPGSIFTTPGSAESETLAYDIIDEFLQDFSEVDLPIPQFRTDFVMDKETQSLLLRDYRNGMKNIIKTHVNIDSSRLNIDFRNISFDGIYDRSDNIPEVYNFMSPRTLSYLARLIKTMCEMGLSYQDREVYHLFIDGMIGLGTNSTQDADTEAFVTMIDEYQKSVYYLVDDLLAKYSRNVQAATGIKLDIEDKKAIDDDKSITGLVKNVIRLHDEGEFSNASDAIFNTVNAINEEFCINQNPAKALEKLKEFETDVTKLLQFRSDYESVLQFIEVLGLHSNMGNAITKSILEHDIIDAYKFYYTLC